MKTLRKNLTRIFALTLCIVMLILSVFAFGNESGVGIAANGGLVFAADDKTENGTGLYKEGGTWKYYENGQFQKVTGIVPRASDGKMFYVEDGVFKKSTGLAKSLTDKKWYYVEKGAVKNATGITKSLKDGKWYYVKDGAFDKTYTGLTKSLKDGNWYYVKKGVMQSKVARPKASVAKYGSDSTRLMVSWKEVPGADGYYVYRATKKNGNYELVNLTETSCKYLDWNLSANKTYYYRVEAFVYEGVRSIYNRTFVSKSSVVSGSTPKLDTKTYYSSDTLMKSSNTLSIGTATTTWAGRIYDRLEQGNNFYIRVKTNDASKAEQVMTKLQNLVRKKSDLGIGFEYSLGNSKGVYHDGKGYIFKVDAEAYTYVKKYIKMAYKERMAEYKTYLNSGKSPEYFWTWQHEYARSETFYAGEYRDNPLECKYGTPFNKMSTESKLLTVTAGTSRLVRTDYMLYDYNGNIGGGSKGIFMRLYNKNLRGVCSGFAYVNSTICYYLGIPCWRVPDYSLNHEWAIAKVKTSKGKTVYYLLDNGCVRLITSAKVLKNGDSNIGDYRAATKRAMGKDYPW